MKFGKIGREDAHPLIADDQAAQRRVEQARRCSAWTEMDPARLVRREGGYYVDSDSDECFRVYRGDALSPGGAVVSDVTPLRFYVDADDGLIFLERQPQTWTEIVYQRERAQAPR